MTACTGDDGTSRVVVESTNDTCEVAETELVAGKTLFEVHNRGDQVTEVYVYADGDRVVSEKENIGPGLEATFTASLSAGTYEIACKPGMTGDGIRQEITVTGDGGAALPEEGDLTLRFTAVDYSWEGFDPSGISAGDSVEFEMLNDGTVEHEFEVFGPDGEVLGEIGPTGSGVTGTVILTLDDAGEYTYVCGLEGHEELGMSGSFEVSE